MNSYKEVNKLLNDLHEVRIVSVSVSKFREGCNSTYQINSKKYFFEATYRFNTGGELKMVLAGGAREAFASLDTIETTFKEDFNARKAAWKEYETIKKAFKTGKFHHSRYNGNGVIIYGRDDSSPTGVSSICECSTIEVVDNLASYFGQPGCISPTEKS